jgi:hypothetical protein
MVPIAVLSAIRLVFGMVAIVPAPVTVSTIAVSAPWIDDTASEDERKQQ